MARNDRLVRILTVAQLLATRRRGFSVKELADEHGWHWRTLYRDLQALQGAGFPIEDVGDHRYRILDGWQPPGAGPRADELLALFVAREAAAGWRTTRLGKSLDSLWLKLSTRRGQLALPVDTPPWFSVRSSLAIDYGPHRQTIDAIERACEERRVLRCTYRTLSRDDVTERDIEPGLLHWDPALESLYVLAWCRLRRDVRVFAVHRFLTVTLLPDTFAARLSTSRSALQRAFRLWRGDHVETVRIRFAPVVAAEVRERRWHESQRLAATPDGGVVLTLQIARAAEMERWIMGFGPDAEVLEPAVLADRLRSRHGAAAGGLIGAATAHRVPTLSLADKPPGETRRRKTSRS